MGINGSFHHISSTYGWLNTWRHYLKKTIHKNHHIWSSNQTLIPRPFHASSSLGCSMDGRKIKTTAIWMVALSTRIETTPSRIGYSISPGSIYQYLSYPIFGGEFMISPACLMLCWNTCLESHRLLLWCPPVMFLALFGTHFLVWSTTKITYIIKV